MPMHSVTPWQAVSSKRSQGRHRQWAFSPQETATDSSTEVWWSDSTTPTGCWVRSMAMPASMLLAAPETSVARVPSPGGGSASGEPEIFMPGQPARNPGYRIDGSGAFSQRPLHPACQAEHLSY
jgi:hypothetical protein